MISNPCSLSNLDFHDFSLEFQFLNPFFKDFSNLVYIQVKQNSVLCHT